MAEKIEDNAMRALVTPALRALTPEQRQQVIAAMQLVLDASNDARNWTTYWSKAFIAAIKELEAT